MEDFVAVVMAGGQGQRFWPLSTADRPKQFLDLEKRGESLLQATVARLLPQAGSPHRIIVVSGERYRDLLRHQLPFLPLDNLLLEPVGRDTAPSVALAALEVQARFGNTVLGLFPADHRIGDAGAFRATLVVAASTARRTHAIVTLGVAPHCPATGYGYIERGRPVDAGFQVVRFVEKPDRRRAEQYLQAGTFSWNSGIFVATVQTILDELRHHAPDVIEPLEAARRAGTVRDVFPTLPKLSIDYAVMEKTANALVLPADFGWDDIGDWEALGRLLDDHLGGADTVVGHYLGLETHGNIIYTEDEDDVVVAYGIEDLVIVKRRNAVLLVRRDLVQDVKKILQDERLATFSIDRRTVALAAD
jgi:mannose-1-phosphate guanylyltransferase